MVWRERGCLVVVAVVEATWVYGGCFGSHWAINDRSLRPDTLREP